MIQYKKPLSVIDEYLTAHREYLESGYQRNFFIASGPQEPRTGGVILSQLKSREQLEEFLSHDPFVLHDLVAYQIIEFHPVKYHAAFKTFV